MNNLEDAVSQEVQKRLELVVSCDTFAFSKLVKLSDGRSRWRALSNRHNIAFIKTSLVSDPREIKTIQNIRLPLLESATFSSYKSLAYFCNIMVLQPI